MRRTRTSPGKPYEAVGKGSTVEDRPQVSLGEGAERTLKQPYTDTLTHKVILQWWHPGILMSTNSQTYVIMCEHAHEHTDTLRPFWREVEYYDDHMASLSAHGLMLGVPCLNGYPQESMRQPLPISEPQFPHKNKEGVT